MNSITGKMNLSGESPNYMIAPRNVFGFERTKLMLWNLN